jgi:PEP-CTERM motif
MEKISMRLSVVLVIALALGFTTSAKADSYGFSLGVSLDNTVVPGSLVSINAVLLNTGTTAIAFAPSFPGGTPSAQGGSVPFAGISAGGDWSIFSNGFSFGDFYGQFAGVTINPGDSFGFTFGSFLAPTSEPLGSSGTVQLNFGINFTDTIVGNLLTGCTPACDFSSLPNVSYTLGNSASSSNPTFYAATVTGQPVDVPEPSTWEMLSLAGAMAAFPVRRRWSRKKSQAH